MEADLIHVNSPNIAYDESEIVAKYNYLTTTVKRDGNKLTVSFADWEIDWF